MWASSTRWPSTATNRWCSATTGRRGCARSSPSTTPPSARPAAAPGTGLRLRGGRARGRPAALQGDDLQVRLHRHARGGGKAVLLKQDGTADKRVLLRSFGRFVQLLAGRLAPVPTWAPRPRRWSTSPTRPTMWAIDQRFGGTGDSAPLTARGCSPGSAPPSTRCSGPPTWPAAGRRAGARRGRRAAGRAAGGQRGGGDRLRPRPGPGQELADRLDIAVEDPEALYDSTATCSAPTPSAGC